MNYIHIEAITLEGIQGVLFKVDRVCKDSKLDLGDLVDLEATASQILDDAITLVAFILVSLHSVRVYLT